MFLALLFFLQGLLWGGCGRMNFPGRSRTADKTVVQPADSAGMAPAASIYEGLSEEQIEAIDSLDDGKLVVMADSLIGADSLSADSLDILPDSLSLALTDSLSRPDSIRYDSLGRRLYGDPFIDDIVTSTNKDSLVYDVRSGVIHFYKDVHIIMEDQQAELKNSDFVEIDMETKMIYAHGITDTVGTYSRPTFVDAGHEYDMDSITYNINSGKMKIRGVWTTEGDGFLRGAAIKKMPDNSFNIIKGTYTTCDDPHPHYEIRLARGKTIPGQKTIFQYAYLVIEDVPIPFLALPFGFFPMNDQRSSGFIMPSFGEEYVKGFYLRDIGYQYSPNDYLSARLLGSFYTLGSWEANLQANYRLRYKFDGSLNFKYADNKFGDRGSADYHDTKTYSIQWSHRQDSKFKPGQVFSASVNFTSSQANKYAPGSVNDFAQNQTNSSISFSKNWAGTPFSLSASVQHSQINRDTTVSFTMPSLSFNMSRINPFKFKNRRPGPERWYEKISMSYSGSLTNQVSGVKEYNLFKPDMFKQLETGMSHNIPVNASFTLFNYINITPNLTYREDWNTRRYERRWDEQEQRQVTDTVWGFNRVYQYSGSVGANTTIYGMYEFTNPRSKIAALRHTLTPNIGFSFRPDFGKDTYGFYQWTQANGAGDYDYYSPYRNAPGRGAQASMSFSLSQTLEAKVRSDRDSTGMKKVKIIDDFSFSFNYNFLADSLKLSPSIPVNFRSTIINGFNINLSTSFGITDVDANGRPIDRYFWESGSRGMPRLERLGTSFNWSKSFGEGAPNARNTGSNITDPNSMYNNPYDPYYNDAPVGSEEEEQQRQANLHAYRNLLTSQYYDFSVPLNLNFSYSINYANNGVKKTITQTASFGASINLTPKWGLTVNSGYDFEAKRLIPTSRLVLTRDLHCMQMEFSWVPLGPMKSWNFRINITSNILKDLKYEKSGSRYDELLYDR